MVEEKNGQAFVGSTKRGEDPNTELGMMGGGTDNIGNDEFEILQVMCSFKVDLYRIKSNQEKISKAKDEQEEINNYLGEN